MHSIHKDFGTVNHRFDAFRQRFIFRVEKLITQIKIWIALTETGKRCTSSHRLVIRIISMAKFESRQYDACETCVPIGYSSLKDVPILPFEMFRLGPARKRYLFGHEINPLLTKLVRSRSWILASSFFFALLLSSFSIRECASKNLINIQPS